MRAALALAFSAALIRSPLCRGETFTWNGGNGAFDDPQNWDPYEPNGNPPVVGPPGSADNAIFSGGGTSIVTTAGNNTASTWFIGRDVTIDGKYSSAEVFVENSTLSFTANSELTVSNKVLDVHGQMLIGSDVAVTSEVSAIEGHGGTVSVDGERATWANQKWLIVGNKGPGAVTIQNSGTVTSDEARIGVDYGDVTVDGDGSTLNVNILNVGMARDGTLRISAGGQVSARSASIGRQSLPGFSGTATVEGDNSTFDVTGTLLVGLYGAGALSINNGGTVESAGGLLAGREDSQATVTVSGMDSSWSSLDTLVVGRGGSATLTIKDQGTVDSQGGLLATEGGSKAGVVVTGDGSSWESGPLEIGRAGGGTLQVLERATVSSDSGSLGTEAEGVGNVFVNGQGAAWNNEGALEVGVSGNAQLSIQSGGTVTSETGYLGVERNSSGNVLVWGDASVWENEGVLEVGVKGSGFLDLQSGGQVNSLSGIVGAEVDSDGAVNVSGGNSSWSNAGFVIVGKGGDAALRISAGGGALALSAIIGSEPGSTGLVVVTDGATRFDSLGFIVIGDEGEGELDITQGATVNSSLPSAIAVAENSIGAVTVSGRDIDGNPATWAHVSTLEVAGKGQGTMSIADGGVVTTTTGYIARRADSDGQVTVQDAGSIWELSDSLSVGGGSEPGGTGKLTVRGDGAVTVANTLVVGGDGTVNLDGGRMAVGTGGLPTNVGALRVGPGGLVAGVGTVIGNLTNEGEVAPGNSPGTLKVQGNFTQGVNGILNLEIGSTAADLLQVTGNAKLGGTLNLGLFDGFIPHAGATYDLLTASNLSGAFAKIDLPDLGVGRSWQFNYGADRFSIAVVPEPSSLLMAAVGLAAAVVTFVTRSGRIAVSTRWVGQTRHHRGNRPAGSRRRIAPRRHLARPARKPGRHAARPRLDDQSAAQIRLLDPLGRHAQLRRRGTL
jgi:T5SS/PEP-CTERM-associated repeat protein